MPPPSMPPPEPRDSLPVLYVCAWCRRVRTGDDWGLVCDYARPDTRFTHGICPPCLDAHFGELLRTG